MPRRKRFLHPDEPMTRFLWLVLVVIGLELATVTWLLLQPAPIA